MLRFLDRFVPSELQLGESVISSEARNLSSCVGISMFPYLLCRLSVCNAQAGASPKVRKNCRGRQFYEF